MSPHPKFDPLSPERLHQMIDIALKQPQLPVRHGMAWLSFWTAPRTALAVMAAVILMIEINFAPLSTQVPTPSTDDGAYNDVSDMMMIDVLDSLS